VAAVTIGLGAQDEILKRGGVGRYFEDPQVPKKGIPSRAQWTYQSLRPPHSQIIVCHFVTVRISLFPS
jgi:hypothetical protein